MTKDTLKKYQRLRMEQENLRDVMQKLDAVMTAPKVQRLRSMPTGGGNKNALEDAITRHMELEYRYINGITNSNSPQTDFIKAFGGDKVLPITDEREDTFQFKLIEAFNTDVLKQVYGSANVTTTEDEITVKVNNSELPAYVYVIDLIMRDDRVKRIVLPVGYVSELGDITYSDSDAIGYDVTITAQSDSSGNTHYEYTTIKK